MKRFTLYCSLLAVHGSLLADPAMQDAGKTLAAVDEIKAAVELFVNARTAGSSDDFIVAVAKVKVMADAGQTFFRFLLAVYAAQEPLCGLSEEQRKRYLDEGRPLMRNHAETGNPLAQYLIGLDCEFNLGKTDEGLAWLERAAEAGQALAQNSLGMKH